MYGLADRGDKNKANSVFVLFSYKWANTTAIGNKTQTNEKLKWWIRKQTANSTRLMDQGQLWYSKHPRIRTCGLRTFRQKFATLITKNIRTCIAKQYQAGSKMLPLLGFSEIMINNLTKEIYCSSAIDFPVCNYDNILF